MANIGSNGIIRHIDNPANAIVSATEGSTVTWAVSVDAGTVIARAVAAGKGLHYTGALAAAANDHNEFCSNNLNFAGQEGHAAMEILLQLDDWSAVCVNFGFNDDVLDAATTNPVELSVLTPAWNAATFVGLVYDTDATNDEFHCLWVDDGSSNITLSSDSIGGDPVRLKGCIPTASKWLYMKVAIDDRGSGNGVSATFTVADHTGKSFEKKFNTSVDRDCPLCYYLGIENRAASAVNIYIRTPNWEQTIPDM